MARQRVPFIVNHVGLLRGRSCAFVRYARPTAVLIVHTDDTRFGRLLRVVQQTKVPGRQVPLEFFGRSLQEGLDGSLVLACLVHGDRLDRGVDLRKE